MSANDTTTTDLGPCEVCGAPATDEVCDINRMPEGVQVWVAVCDAHADIIDADADDVDTPDADVSEVADGVYLTHAGVIRVTPDAVEGWWVEGGWETPGAVPAVSRERHPSVSVASMCADIDQRLTRLADRTHVQP